MKRIGIIAALSGELKPLVQGWEKRGQTYRGRIGGMDCIAIAGGMGAEAAAHACNRVMVDGPLDALVSIGWAGSLSCGLKPPHACVVSEVIDGRTQESYPTNWPEGQRLLTTNHVVRHEEKRELAAQFQVPLVDMEAATVARIAQEKQIAFYCFKGISDGSNDKLPDFNRFLGKNGQLRMAPFVIYALLHPQYWAALSQLGRNSKAAAFNLATLVTESLRQQSR
ncbi:MAG TPA: nucleoside phosphorylase [Pseudacidobacterium sp.]|jgi:adenosylhomocysteine nucleosidase|nr:nucleoside phosphorylase [Pseudacidobacterium sp.]